MKVNDQEGKKFEDFTAALFQAVYDHFGYSSAESYKLENLIDSAINVDEQTFDIASIPKSYRQLMDDALLKFNTTHNLKLEWN